LALPKLFLAHGQFVSTPLYKDWMSPFSVETYNIFLLSISTEYAAVVFNCLVQILLSFSLFLLISSRFSKQAGIFGIITFYLCPDMVILFNSAKPDGILFGLIFLSFHYLFLWYEGSERKYFFLASIFSGFALATKYQALYFFVTICIICFLMVVFKLKKENIKSSLKYLFIFGFIASAISSPWYIKNYILTGDPIWPFGFDIFESNFWSEKLNLKYKNWSLGPGKSTFNYIFGFWNITLEQENWKWGLLIPYLPYNLALLPGIFFFKRSNNEKSIIFFILISVIIFYSIWFSGYQQKRYLLPAMGLLSVITSPIFVEMYKHRLTKYAARFLLYSVLLFSIFYTVFFNIGFFSNAFGFETKNSFLNRKINFYDGIKYINENTPEDAVILVNDLKTFYFNRKWVYIPLYVQDDFNLDLNKAVKFLKDNKITHIFNPYNREKEKIINELIKNKFIESIYENQSSKVILSRSLSKYGTTSIVIYKVNQKRYN